MISEPEGFHSRWPQTATGFQCCFIYPWNVYKGKHHFVYLPSYQPTSRKTTSFLSDHDQSIFSL